MDAPAGGAVVTEAQGRTLLITLNRPHVGNAINSDMASALSAAVQRLDCDEGLSVGVLTGNGRGFCSGMDLKAFASTGPPNGLDPFLRNGSRKPLVVAVEGFAIAGGFELALTGDLLVAAKGAKLGLPEVTLGFFAAGGGLLRLLQRVSQEVVMELALTGDLITAENAHAHGLVSRLTEPGEALAVAVELAERISRNAPLGVIATKRLVRDAHGQSQEAFWLAQAELAREVFASHDGKEGSKAFIEKRKPTWTGS